MKRIDDFFINPFSPYPSSPHPSPTARQRALVAKHRIQNFTKSKEKP
jgi:hypothetical protein